MNVRIMNSFTVIKRNATRVKTHLMFLRRSHQHVMNYNTYMCQKRYLSANIFLFKTSTIDSDDELELGSDENYNIHTERGFARDLLFRNCKDVLLNRIYNCVSVQELLNIFNNNFKYYNCEHFVQSVFILWDFKKVFHDINKGSDTNIEKLNEFFKTLNESDSFQKFLCLIEDKISSFDVNQLSYLLLYLSKLGFSIQTRTLQLLCLKIEEKLLNNFHISPASRFLEAIFNETNLRSYFMAQNLIPLVFKEIGSCNSVTHLKDLTISLNKLHHVVKDEEMEKYKRVVIKFLDNQSISAKDYDVVLKIILFLNYPKWRNENTILMSKCILTLKDNLSSLDVNELLILYEVFFKIEEPGEILSELQRCAARYLQQLDEDVMSPQKITLFSSLIYFAPPSYQKQFQVVVEEYVQQCNSLGNLILLRKLLSYLKISNHEVCQLYWDKVFDHLKINKNDNALNIATNYMNFHNDVRDYRHTKFEQEILRQLEMMSRETSHQFFPQKLSQILSFALIYSSDTHFLEYLINKLEDNWQQLTSKDCIKLSSNLNLLNRMPNRYLKVNYVDRINIFLNKILEKETASDEKMWKNDVLLKSCIFNKSIGRNLVDNLLMKYNYLEHMSSKTIGNIYFCYHSTDSLIPDVIDNMVDYSINYKDHLLGYNIQRILYLCYYLGYCPKRSSDFFTGATDIIIRDQERTRGLSLIQSALALCYFNELPNSLLQSVINKEFFNKLDIELENCYSKEKYPQRVRNTLMQLNRAVCLDYPELNVRWLHQKYVDEVNKAVLVQNQRQNQNSYKVKEALSKLISRKDAISENVQTPYGYIIDFVINLDSQGQITTETTEVQERLAILLIPCQAFTKFLVQLKGEYQLRNRHLEMLGYKVLLINYHHFKSLQNQDQVKFLSELIWPKRTNFVKDVIR